MHSGFSQMLLSNPNVSVESLIAIFFLGLMRIAPLVAIAPFFGARLPNGVKVGIALSITVILLPHNVLTLTSPISFGMPWVALALKEILIGFILAFLASIPFYIAETSGIFIDFMRGSSSMMMQDPALQNQVSPVGLLYNYILIVLFFQIGGPFIFLNAVLDSYNVIPSSEMLPSTFFLFDRPFWQLIASLAHRVISLGIQLAAPSIVAILMAEMFLGIANRMAPQVQIAFLGMSLKSLLGLSLLFIAWFFILKQLAKQSEIWLKTIDTVLQTFGS